MPRDTYQTQLEDLRGGVAALADTVLDRYEAAVDVLETGDAESARRIVDGDDEINDWYLDLETDCIDLIAHQQPLASDLRCIASSFKIITDLERVGDLATNIATYGREAGGGLTGEYSLADPAQQAGDLLAEAIDAYTRRDAESARSIARRDDELDTQCRQASDAVARDLMSVSSTRSTDENTVIEDVRRALLTVRDIERVGDHAVNVCARTLYMIDNDDALIY